MPNLTDELERWRGQVDEKLVGIFHRLDSLAVRIDRLIESIAVEERVAHHDLNTKMRELEDRIRKAELNYSKMVGISIGVAMVVSGIFELVVSLLRR